MTLLIPAALGYARAGFRVLPLHSPIFHDEGVLCSCLKPACKSIGKHPKGVIGDASSDETVIRSWWNRWPSANIGVCTDGFAVIDIDPVHDGQKNWEAACFGEGLPLSPEVATGSGGRHLFFRAEGIPCSVDRVVRGVDVRGKGGYVVAPPSVHASGLVYSWTTGSVPLSREFVLTWPLLPEWLREKCLTVNEFERGADYAKP